MESKNDYEYEKMQNNFFHPTKASPMKYPQSSLRPDFHEENGKATVPRFTSMSNNFMPNTPLKDPQHLEWSAPCKDLTIDSATLFEYLDAMNERIEQLNNSMVAMQENVDSRIFQTEAKTSELLSKLVTDTTQEIADQIQPLKEDATRSKEIIEASYQKLVNDLNFLKNDHTMTSCNLKAEIENLNGRVTYLEEQISSKSAENLVQMNEISNLKLLFEQQSQNYNSNIKEMYVLMERVFERITYLGTKQSQSNNRQRKSTTSKKTISKEEHTSLDRKEMADNRKKDNDEEDHRPYQNELFQPTSNKLQTCCTCCICSDSCTCTSRFRMDITNKIDSIEIVANINSCNLEEIKNEMISLKNDLQSKVRIDLSSIENKYESAISDYHKLIRSLELGQDQNHEKVMTRHLETKLDDFNLRLDELDTKFNTIQNNQTCPKTSLKPFIRKNRFKPNSYTPYRPEIEYVYRGQCDLGHQCHRNCQVLKQSFLGN